MASEDWRDHIINKFFSEPKPLSQTECDGLAKAITGAADIRRVSLPGSFSYTVVCVKESGNEVVSFREIGNKLDEYTTNLAKDIHGDLVPSFTYHGLVEGADRPLSIYVMPYLPGVSCVEELECEVELNAEIEARHIRFMQHLARYFARAWANPQSINPVTRKQTETSIRRRLQILKEATGLDLETYVSKLFDEDYSAVLTHGDLSHANILVDEDTFEITGIVDWPLASILPFGMDFEALYGSLGYQDFQGWHDYACRPQLLEAFWLEFWAATGIEDDTRRTKIRATAESAGKVGAYLRYAFRQNEDGSSSDVLLDAVPDFLHAWFKD
ncbi:aminoglycoside phosphotransferase family protein [Aspergillus stella-maris]|uniref:aminoglycoside phosphotransferase family protein n=1 Tax=Aspergillus stella-maris TaxID=1810926 RepID=UPI003CCCF11C